jgi:hypothetical protein
MPITPQTSSVIAKIELSRGRHSNGARVARLGVRRRSRTSEETTRLQAGSVKVRSNVGVCVLALGAERLGAGDR